MIGVIGAGPCGLYAAFRLVSAGHRVVVFEADAEVASGVKNWGHVTLFSNLSLNMPADARGALERGIGTQAGASAREMSHDAAEGGFGAVVDASGTYGTSTAVASGVGGVRAPGERAADAAGKVLRVIPDPGSVGSSLAGKRVAVLGSGYSAVTALKGLCDTAAGPPASIAWITRRRRGRAVYKTVEDDPLPQRDLLATYGNHLAAAALEGRTTPNGARIQVHPGAAVAAMRLDATDGHLALTLEVDDGAATTLHQLDVDVLVSLVGYRPDASIHSELHMHACYASDGPIKLAASLLGAAGGDCLKQAAPGVGTLLQPEPNFFIIGMKSYGRNTSFLMRVGYEQVALLVDALQDLADLGPLDGASGPAPPSNGAPATAAAALKVQAC